MDISSGKDINLDTSRVAYVSMCNWFTLCSLVYSEFREEFKQKVAMLSIPENPTFQKNVTEQKDLKSSLPHWFSGRDMANRLYQDDSPSLQSYIVQPISLWRYFVHWSQSKCSARSLLYLYNLCRFWTGHFWSEASFREGLKAPGCFWHGLEFLESP